MAAELPRLEKVRHVRNHILELTFKDGVKVQMDFRDKVIGGGPMIKPLEDVAYFRQVRLDPEFGSLSWPNEFDICPEVLYSEATGKRIRLSKPA